MPPRGLWLSDNGLEEWFESVDARRDSKAAPADDPSSSWEVVDMDENEDAREYKRSLGL